MGDVSIYFLRRPTRLQPAAWMTGHYVMCTPNAFPANMATTFATVIMDIMEMGELAHVCCLCSTIGQSNLTN